MLPSDNGNNSKITGTYTSDGVFIPDRIMTPSELSRATAETAPAQKAVELSRSFTGGENSGFGPNGAVVQRVNPEWELDPATGKKFYPLPIFGTFTGEENAYTPGAGQSAPNESQPMTPSRLNAAGATSAANGAAPTSSADSYFTDRQNNANFAERLKSPFMDDNLAVQNTVQQPMTPPRLNSTAENAAAQQKNIQAAAIGNEFPIAGAQTYSDPKELLDNYVKSLYYGDTNNSQKQASPDALEKSIDKYWYEDGESGGAASDSAGKTGTYKYINDPMNWENELYGNITARIDSLSPYLNEKNRVQSIDDIILEEAEKLQDKYSTAYAASGSWSARILSPGLYDKLTPLFTEYPTENTEVKHPLLKVGVDGFFDGFYTGLTYEASKGISHESTGLGETSKVYSANGDPTLRGTRRLSFDSMMEDGLEVNGNTFKMNEHTYNSLFKSGRKDIMPDDILDALKVDPLPAKPGSVCYTNPSTGTAVFVNPQTKEIVGIWPTNFIK